MHNLAIWVLCAIHFGEFVGARLCSSIALPQLSRPIRSQQLDHIHGTIRIHPSPMMFLFFHYLIISDILF